jgi:chromosome segregation ATPase
LKKLVASSPEQIDQITSDHEELTPANEILQRELGEANESVTRLTNDLSSLEQNLANLAASSCDSKQDREFAKEQLQRAHSQREEKFIQHISALNEELAIASKTITSHETRISRPRKQLKANETALAVKDDQILELNDSREQLAQQSQIQKAHCTELASSIGFPRSPRSQRSQLPDQQHLDSSVASREIHTSSLR